MNIEQNISRLKYLLSLYKLSVEEFLALINKGLKKPLIEEDIFSKEIKLNYLKRIDKFFNKGLHFYLDPKSPKISKDASIFFRKQSFNSDLNLEAKRVVNQFEEIKISLSALAKLSDFETNRILRNYKITDDPKAVAQKIREELYPEFSSNLKDFLRSLISKFAEKNILVFEFIEYWNQKERTNIDGFYLNPNVIVLKRHQISFRREIFTLIHELGHYLLDEEEIEELDYSSIMKNDASAIERWCNDLAYYFLAGEYSDVIDKLETATHRNDYNYELIENISRKTHLSRIALFTRLLFQNKISFDNYNKVKTDLDEQYQAILKQKEEAKKKNKELGIKQKGSAPQPIKSPLLVSTIQTAFYEGILNEYEVCKYLNIKPAKLSEFVS